MSRERTTWNRNQVRKEGSMQRQADPYLLNQEHVKQQPSADKYTNGTPSSWAEDVHSPNEWEREYSGGTTSRNEIGEPEFRPDTFKSASQALLVRKADLCVKVARQMMPKASEPMVEDQAVSLMNLPDSDLIETFQRLAQDEQGQQDQEHQDQKQGGQGQQDQEQQHEDQKQGGVGQQDPDPEQEPVAQQQGQQAGMQQQSAAYQTAMQQCVQALQKGDQQKAQAAVQQMVQEAMKQQQAPQAVAASTRRQAAAPRKADQPGQQPQQQQAQDQGQPQQQQAQIQEMVDKAVQGLQQPQQPQAQGQGQSPEPQSEDALLDEMLAPQAGDMVAPPMGEVELDPSQMDSGEVQLTSDDDVLKTLFATQESQQQEEQEQQAEQQQHQAAVRSPSSRTLGTRPTAGVSRVGGSGAPMSKTAGSDVDRLSNLWTSAPDVREHFGLR